MRASAIFFSVARKQMASKRCGWLEVAFSISVIKSLTTTTPAPEPYVKARKRIGRFRQGQPDH